ncbi:MAG: hypothetical protein AAF649_00930 [Verrucomicrobiota bacterium]
MKKLPVRRLKNGSYIWEVSPFRWIESLDAETRERLNRSISVEYPERLERYQISTGVGILS